MVKNTTQIAKLHNRHGKLNELPKQLGMARIGLADDTNQVFIGNDENPDLQERYDSNIFPYGNVEILTEFSPLPKIIKYSPHLDGEQIFYLIDVIGNNFSGVNLENNKILINGEEINFSVESSNIDKVVEEINNHKFNKYAVKAKNNNGNLELITFADDLVLQDVVGENTLSLLGFENEAIEATPLTKRTLQEILDDNFCIKAFDVKGDGEFDDSKQINKAFDIIYDFSNLAEIHNKRLYFPASSYIIMEESLKLYSNTYIFGEGIDKSIIKGNGNNPLFIFENDSENITFDSLTFDASEIIANKIFELHNCNNIIFKNCKFIAGNDSNFIANETNTFVTVNNIVFEDCIFDGNNKDVSLILKGTIDKFLITNCIFKNILISNPIILEGSESFIQNGIIANNSFENCTSDNLILANDKVKYVSVVKSLVDERYLTNDSYQVFKQNGVEDYHKLNYCDSPKSTTDPNKFLRSNFYQDIYDYVQVLYNKFGKEALAVISPENDNEITNYFTLEQGTADKSLRLKSTSVDENVIIGVGENANLHLGDFSENSDTSIIFDRNIDVNDKIIKNTAPGGNIVFKVDNDKILQIQTNEDDEYAERIANKIDAIPNVDFVIKTTNSDNRFVIDFDTISEAVSEIDTSEFPLMYFSPEKYGNNVGLKDISINVRMPFVPVSEQINVALEWNNASINHYRVGDKVYIIDTNENKTYYECVLEHDCIFNSTDDNENFAEELNHSPAYWVSYTPSTEEEANEIDEYTSFYNVYWYEGDVVKYINDSEVFFYICLKDNYADYEYINDNKGISFFKDINSGYWKQLIIDADNTQNYFYNYGRYTYTRDENNDVILQNYISSNTIVTLPELMNEIITAPDIKYITISSVDERPIENTDNKKYLFSFDDVDINARDVNGYVYSSWESNYHYNVGDKVSHNYSNYKCLVEHTSSNIYEIHNSEIWQRLNESGYDYRLNFERDLWEMDSEGKLYKENFVFEHNFSGHTLKLAMYDKDNELIKTITNDYSGIFATPYTQWDANTVFIKGQYIQHDSVNYVVMSNFTSGDTFETESAEVIYLKPFNKTYWDSETEYFVGQYIKSSDSENFDTYRVISTDNEISYVSGNSLEEDVENGHLEKMPNKYVQIGSSGKILITINYLRGN